LVKGTGLFSFVVETATAHNVRARVSRPSVERKRNSDLLVAYYHLVFTLPHDLNGWAQCHPEVIYACLFQSVWSTLKAFGADPRRLGGELGMTAVLHTWDRKLSQHLHLHCLVPGGALLDDGTWKTVKGTYLFPVRALSRCFRGTLVRPCVGESRPVTCIASQVPARSIGCCPR